MRSLVDALRPILGVVFLAGYAWYTFAPGSFGTDLFLGVGAVLFVLSVPWASAFHRVFALVACLALAAVLITGRFEFADFYRGMPTYLGIVAVLLVLSIAGYPIRAARYEVQIRALMAALTRRGVSIKATAGALGHVLGAVLDVGAFVLIDVITGRSAPKERLEALKWAGRTFSFAPLWTNLNVLTATTIVLTGVSYPKLLAVTLPFVLLGLTGTLFFAQRAGGEVEEIPQSSLDRGAAAVLLYPVLLVAAVALVNVMFPVLPLTSAIAVTVAVIVLLIAALAAVLAAGHHPWRGSGGRRKDPSRPRTPSSPCSGRPASSYSPCKPSAPSRRSARFSRRCQPSWSPPRWRSSWPSGSSPASTSYRWCSC